MGIKITKTKQNKTKSLSYRSQSKRILLKRGANNQLLNRFQKFTFHHILERIKLNSISLVFAIKTSSSTFKSYTDLHCL